MNRLKAIIVDDERLARKELVLMLKEYDNIEVTGEADSVNSAVQLIHTKRPDVIFLDIQMPGESGFDLVNLIETNAKIIFVTAFDEFAIRAFDINALDYLLKPVNPKRLKQTIDKLNSYKNDEPTFDAKLQNEDTLFLSVNSKMVFIKISSIILIKAAGDYTEIITSKGIKGLTLTSMKEWQQRLPTVYFERIHRSTIINLNKVERIEEGESASANIYLHEFSEPVSMSRRYAYKLKHKLK